MSKSISWIKQPIACFLVVLLLSPLAEAANQQLPSAPLPQMAENQPPSGQTQSSQQNSGTPASPAAGQSQQAAPSANQQSPAPVGTAVAPIVTPEGAPGSRPAGAAIAPAKQRRRHTLAIRVALLVGAGVAIGTVAAASMGSPSHPH
ncbi:MAG: hypothetical protein WA414_10455 [Acidobacteriaceae bacterium]